MKIQGMGNLEGYYQKAAQAVSHDPAKATRFQSRGNAGGVQVQGFSTPQGVDKEGSEQNGELVAKQVQVQELIKRQEESMKMMKNLLFLITPGMGDLLEQGEKANQAKEA
jgi:hypothetical protein